MGAGLAVINRSRSQTAVALDDAEQSLQFARQAVDDMYTRIATDWLTDDLEITPTKRDFLEKAHRIYQRLADEAPSDPLSQWEAGTAYYRVAQIQHKLGQYRQAKQAYLVSLDIREALLDEFSNDPDRRAQLAGTYRDLGQLHADQEQIAKAAEKWDVAHKMLSTLNDTQTDVAEYRSALAACQLDVAGLDIRQGKCEEAERLIRTAKETYESLWAADRDSIDHRLGKACSGMMLARALRFDGRLDEAEEVAYRAEVDSNAFAEEAYDSPTYDRVRIAALVEYADLLYATHRIVESAELLDQARDLALKSTPGGLAPHHLMTQVISRTKEWTRYVQPEAFRRILEIDIRRGRALSKLDRHYEPQQTLADSIRAAYALQDGPPSSTVRRGRGRGASRTG